MGFFGRIFLLAKYKILEFLGFTVIPVVDENDVGYIQGFYSVDPEKLREVIRIGTPTFGRIVTFEFDLSDPDGVTAFENLKKLIPSSSGYHAKITCGTNTITFEFEDPAEAENVKTPWIRYAEMKKQQKEEQDQNKSS